MDAALVASCCLVFVIACLFGACLFALRRGWQRAAALALSGLDKGREL